MYAVAFDLDGEALKENYHVPSWENAYSDIRKFMESRGFTWQQRSLYFGGPAIDAVTCVLTIVQMSQRFPWLAPALTDMRMLRIEDNNDLRPAVEQGAVVTVPA